VAVAAVPCPPDVPAGRILSQRIAADCRYQQVSAQRSERHCVPMPEKVFSVMFGVLELLVLVVGISVMLLAAAAVL
jgi:hypothetical protein